MTPSASKLTQPTELILYVRTRTDLIGGKRRDIIEDWIQRCPSNICKMLLILSLLANYIPIQEEQRMSQFGVRVADQLAYSWSTIRGGEMVLALHKAWNPCILPLARRILMPTTVGDEAPKNRSDLKKDSEEEDSASVM
jgi:hypothetical protein